MPPTKFNMLIGVLSLFLDDAKQDKLAGSWITGFQWRMHLAAGSSDVVVTPGDPFRFVFLYDVQACSACSGCFADFNGDGVVGPFDLATLLGNWGACE